MNNKKGNLYWITGLQASGKTTIGIQLYYRLKDDGRDIVILDGDILKEIVGKTVGYTREERLDRAYQYCHLCSLLINQGIDVIICTISMFDEIRDWNLQNIDNYIEVFLDVKEEVLRSRRRENGCHIDEKNIVGKDIDVEWPKNPDVIIKNNGDHSVSDCVNLILKVKPKQKRLSINDKEYWNRYYKDKKNVSTPSPFACAMYEEYMRPGIKLLELGCGNGRDSLFFVKKGVSVVAIDSSDDAIRLLQDKKSNNAFFICDDFVNATVVYKRYYDAIYSRFTMHSITAGDQKKVIYNAYNGLKEGGLFMVEARTVNDVFYGQGDEIARDTFLKDGHQRRFIRKEEFEKQIETVGFNIIYSEESEDFAPYKDEKPAVLRIVAKK